MFRRLDLATPVWYDMTIMANGDDVLRELRRRGDLSPAVESKLPHFPACILTSLHYDPQCEGRVTTSKSQESLHNT